MNLFDINADFLSHPGYPFRIHVTNVAASFEEKLHQKAAEFHDFGKLSREFQEYIKDPNNSDKTRHAFNSAIFFLLNNNLKIDKESFAIFFSILKHHGDLLDVDTYILDNLDDEDKFEESFESVSSICRQVSLSWSSEKEAGDLIEIFDTDSFSQDYNLRGLDSYFKIKEVFSRLVFADKYEAIFKSCYSPSTDFDASLQISKLLDLISGKQNKMSAIRNQAREEIVQNYKANSKKRIFIIEAPTGIGKTFTALHLALEIAKDKGKKRIINALPMTSIIDQTYQEYGATISEKHLLKFHHLTNAKSYDEQQQEAEQAGVEAEERLVRQKNDYIGASWSGDDVIVTTFNQLFNALFSNKNRELIKFWALNETVVILDEIQAIPRILLKDVAHVIGFLSRAFNIDFILMSATIPAIKSFLDQDTMAELLDNRYYEMDFNNRYELCFNPTINDIDSLVKEILLASETYNSVLCVVNTKKLSLEIFNKLEDRFEEEMLYLLSANHIPLHRKTVIGNIKERLDKREKTILISTQVIEAGVDLDFDIGFREFAPLSSIIQTAGRINREGEKPESKLIVTDRIGQSPYDEKDLLYDDVTNLLTTSNQLREKNILPILKKYFQIAIKKTSKDYQLLNEMINLDFETVYKRFNDRFMKEIPNRSPIFIEVEEGIYDYFNKEQNKLIKKLKAAKKLEEKMDIKIRLKELQKKIANYVISVNAEDIKNEKRAFHESNDMRWCPNSFVDLPKGSKYTFKKGWFDDSDGNYFF